MPDQQGHCSPDHFLHPAGLHAACASELAGAGRPSPSAHAHSGPEDHGTPGNCWLAAQSNQLSHLNTSALSYPKMAWGGHGLHEHGSQAKLD